LSGTFPEKPTKRRTVAVPKQYSCIRGYNKNNISYFLISNQFSAFLNFI